MFIPHVLKNCITTCRLKISFILLAIWLLFCRIIYIALACNLACYLVNVIFNFVFLILAKNFPLSSPSILREVANFFKIIITEV